MSTTETAIGPGSAPGSPASSRGSSAGETGKETGKEAGISFREAGIQLGISDKTLRARIRDGSIEGWTVEGKRGLEWRVRLPEGRDPEPGDREGDRDPRRDEGRDGAREDREEERDPLTLALSELAFLRQQLHQRNQAESELRRLLLVSQQALAAAIERPQLPPAKIQNGNSAPPRVRWWPFRRRV